MPKKNQSTKEKAGTRGTEVLIACYLRQGDLFTATTHAFKMPKGDGKDRCLESIINAAIQKGSIGTAHEAAKARGRKLSFKELRAIVLRCFEIKREIPMGSETGNETDNIIRSINCLPDGAIKNKYLKKIFDICAGEKKWMKQLEIALLFPEGDLKNDCLKSILSVLVTDGRLKEAIEVVKYLNRRLNTVELETIVIYNLRRDLLDDAATAAVELPDVDNKIKYLTKIIERYMGKDNHVRAREVADILNMISRD